MANWIIVVDDDTSNLKMAGHILSKANMRVTALKSGQSLLDYVRDKGTPDLVLLDINMPEMDGFETLMKLRSYESEAGVDEVPVIFLTADDTPDTETMGFEVGVSDYIKKPFDPAVLLRRIGNILSKQEKIMNLRAEATQDKLTGFLNKMSGKSVFTNMCASKRGALLMLDLDSFKLVNDIYGHDMGDRVLVSFARILSETVPAGSVGARMGGDEFEAFCEGLYDEKSVAELAARINDMMVADAKQLMGENMDIPLGTSIGAIFVPKYGNDYEELEKLADKALYRVKQQGKHGYAVYSPELFAEDEEEGDIDISTVSKILEERSITNMALQLEKDSFSYVYRYVMRYISRNRRSACKVMFSLEKGNVTDEDAFMALCDEFGEHIGDTLRKSDIYMRNRSNKYFILLSDIREDSIGKVIGELIKSWHERHGDSVSLTYETEFIGPAEQKVKAADGAKIVVVDDDVANLQMAGHILSKAGFYVTALKSGQALLDHLEKNIPDAILLDINMPGMDGFETKKRLSVMDRDVADIPVIFLTADESEEAESKGLALGAMDFIKKPFVPDILLLRVRHIIELVRLQRSLSNEVEKKSRENKNLFIHVVQALAEAIDAKDKYTNGHSGRVAKYTKEIARRYGYRDKRLDDVYMIALLHDVGKIGVPDAIINKPTRLTDEEFEVIKSHPGKGAKILSNIREMPSLSIGAGWHHEKYGGGGYPDGLKGEAIPEEARMIAVADAYDAMSSRRSYRGALPQDVVREEIVKGRGVQFDPVFADIMLQMIDEDTNYSMSEQNGD
ncbi:MAG: response regulator [Lachnospiraceae bacterium]|nr:response regulator [Lachnospiraceae bacterium]